MSSHPNQEEQVRECKVKGCPEALMPKGGYCIYHNEIWQTNAENIMWLQEQAETAAALKVWEYIAATPEWDTPIYVLDEGEEHVEYSKSYLPPKSIR